MANVIISPNMNLPVPIPTVDPGPDWANNIVACFGITGSAIDGHNHSSGNGVQINPSGININSDLSFNGNNATLLRSVRLIAQASALSGASDLSCLYASPTSSGDLYYNDGAGNQIRITQSGAITGAAGTITGLPSGTASASYGSSVFVFQAATSTAANVDMGSAILRLNVASSNGLTLSPPSSLSAGSYQLFLPAIPGQTNVMTLDSSGNMGSTTWDAVGQNMTSVGADAIAESMDSVGANVILSTNTRSTAQFANISGQVALTPSCGTFSSTSNTYQDITNLNLVVSPSLGRPVILQVIPDGTGESIVANSGGGNVFLNILNSTSGDSIGSLQIITNGVPTALSYTFMDFPLSGGSISYAAQIKTSAGTTEFYRAIFVAYELH